MVGSEFEEQMGRTGPKQSGGGRTASVGVGTCRRSGRESPVCGAHGAPTPVLTTLLLAHPSLLSEDPHHFCDR